MLFYDFTKLLRPSVVSSVSCFCVVWHGAQNHAGLLVAISQHLQGDSVVGIQIFR